MRNARRGDHLLGYMLEITNAINSNVYDPTGLD
jgi:hypothetical protein